MRGDNMRSAGAGRQSAALNFGSAAESVTPQRKKHVKCLFCRLDSSNSRSVEHIIPESLWNTQHILPRGVVCDACNNYFAREIEKPFLDSPAIARLRFTQSIPNKRGRIPPGEAFLLPHFPVKAYREAFSPHQISLELPPEAVRHVLSKKNGTLLIPSTGEPPERRVISRFLAKMALEALALRLLKKPEGLACLVDDAQLDPIRNFARRGQPQSWPHHARRIYDADRTKLDLDGNAYQTVHEFDFLVTSDQEWYFVFALFGLELAINLGGPCIGSYTRWIDEHQGKSPLYWGNNA